MKVTARGGKWFIGETTQPTYYTATTINAQTTQAPAISTANMNVSSLNLVEVLSVPYLPTSIANCVLWLDAADASTYTNTSGTISAWRDKALGAVTTAQKGSGPTLSSINGLPAFYFNAGANIMAINVTQSTTNRTFFMVLTSVSNDGAYIWPSGGRGWELQHYTSNTLVLSDQNVAYIQYSGTIPIGSPFIISITYAGNANTQINVNGTGPGTFANQSSSSSLSTDNTHFIGGSTGGFAATFRLGEMIEYNSSLTVGQVQQVEGYLAQKWGLTASLPAGHPGLTSQIYKSQRIGSTVGLSVSSSLAYWGPYLLNSGFRTAQPQIFFAIAKLMSQVYTLSTYSLANISNTVSIGSSTPVYIWSVDIPTGAKGKNAILTLFFNLYSGTQFTANQYFDYGIYIDGVPQLKGDVGTIRYVQTSDANYALSSGGVILGLNGMLSAYPIFIPLSISPSASQLQIGIANSLKTMNPTLSVVPAYTSNVTTSSGSSNTSGFIPQNTFTTTGNFTYTVPTNTSAGVPSGVFIYLWGAGGQSYTGLQGSYGGTGGFVSGYYACLPGTALNVVVGQIGGQTPTTGGGGNQYSQNPRGGGFSGVFLGSVSQSNAIAIAGGGGGASETTSQSGGFGGYPTGGFPWSISGSSNWNVPGPGTQTAGGTFSTAFENGTAGTALIGGFGGHGPRGGGGGGGYWGGGGAGAGRGGGGGSSYIGGLSLATYSNGVSYTQSSELPVNILPGGNTSLYYVSGYGHANGGTGLAVIIPAIGANPVQVGVSATLFSA